MANVDKATRILNCVLLDTFSVKNEFEKQNICERFFSLPNNEKPITYRNRTLNEINAFFSNLNIELKKVISTNYGCKLEEIKILEDSKDNKIGADLIVNFSKNKKIETHRIELKFGAKTDKNIGNSEMNQIFEISDSSVNFTNKFSEIKNQQRKFIDNQKNESLEALYSNLEKLLVERSIFFNNLLDKKKIKLNQDRLIQTMTTSGAVKNKQYMENMLTIRIDYCDIVSAGFKIIKKPNLSGEWKIKSIQKQQESNRIEIRVANENKVIKFLLNWKNNYKYKNKKYPALAGLGSSSWNVWILNKL